VLVKKMKLECKPVQVRVRKMNLKVKSVCVRLQKITEKEKDIKVNLESVIVKEHVVMKNLNPVTCGLKKNLVRILYDEASPNIVDCLVKGKATRSSRCPSKSAIISPYVSYELGSQKSIEEDDEENPKKRVPDWAQESSVKRALLTRVNPDHVFDTCEPPDLLDMFAYPATTSTRRDICNSPVQSNIIDSTYVISSDMVGIEESFVAEDCVKELSNETYVVSINKNIQTESNVTKSKDMNGGSWSDEEEADEITFDFSIRDTVEFTSPKKA